jgi:uncharacterized protein (TIGR02300 family)
LKTIPGTEKILADLKGLKRICMSCGARFYDLNKKPIICPSCTVEFTGEIKVKARRGRLPAEIADEPEEEEVAAVEVETEDADSDVETVSLEEIAEDDADEEDADLLVEDDDLEIDDDLDDIDDDDIDEDIAEEDEEK